MINLLADQTDLLNRAKDKIRAGCKRLLIQAATGSGKTYVSSAIVQGAFLKGTTAHFICPRRELIKQTSKTFNKFDITHGYIAADYQHHHRNSVFICSKDTLLRRKGRFEFPKLAIIDEVHFGGEGIDDIIDMYVKAGCIVIGLSATPKPPPVGRPAQFDDMVCGPSVRWLIDNKRLSDYKLFCPDIPDLSGIRKIAGEYNQKQLAERMENDRILIGNCVEHYKKYAAGKLGVTFGVGIKHSRILAQAYQDAGVVAIHVDGTTPEKELTKIIRAYAKREITQLCCADLLCFGFDLSSSSGMDVTVECMTDNAPTESLEKQMQKWGRTMRYKDFPAFIFDHAGNAMKSPEVPKHGMPCWEREWDISPRQKGEEREEKERDVSVRQCVPMDGVPGCWYCHAPSPICPNCGRVYPVKNREIDAIEGDLKEIQVQQVKKEKRMEVGRANDLESIVQIAVERGYKAGWVVTRCKLRKININYGGAVKAMNQVRERNK